MGVEATPCHRLQLPPPMVQYQLQLHAALMAKLGRQGLGQQWPQPSGPQAPVGVVRQGSPRLEQPPYEP